jgi:hypothetical protein
MPLCPTATTNEGHVPGRPAAKRGHVQRRAAKLGMVERPFADNTVSHWTLQRPGT